MRCQTLLFYSNVLSRRHETQLKKPAKGAQYQVEGALFNFSLPGPSACFAGRLTVDIARGSIKLVLEKTIGRIRTGTPASARND